MRMPQAALCVAIVAVLGCHSVPVGAPAPCPKLPSQAREQRDHLIQLDRAGRLVLEPVGDHPRREAIHELVTAWREQVRYCRSLDAYRE